MRGGFARALGVLGAVACGTAGVASETSSETAEVPALRWPPIVDSHVHLA